MKKKAHRTHRKRLVAPVYWSRGSGGPARNAPVGTLRAPLPTVDTQLVAVAPAPSSSNAGLFLAIVAGFGLFLVGTALLPGEALRPAAFHAMLAPHRIDVGLVGVSLVLIGAVLYLLTV